ncbi:Peroxisomal membrane protein 4 [Yarrowia sp. B02]|nr:Peroxisomal membrane protein 4 [Yarrowia sp. B02]
MNSFSKLAENLVDGINDVLTNPAYHEYLAILKGTRNGIVYGGRLRFSHALVMALLFRSGPWSKRWASIFKATRQHATSLGSFVFIYKSILLLLKKSRGDGVANLKHIEHRNHGMDAFIAGLIGGYLVFGRESAPSLNQQIVLYVFSRVIMGFGNLLIKKVLLPMWRQQQMKDGFIGGVSAQSRATKFRNVTWAVFASVCWGLIMYLFRTDPDVIQPSMLHSLKYLYVDSESWTGLSDFL